MIRGSPAGSDILRDIAPLSSPKLNDLIQRQLIELIREKRLPPGSKLPSQRTLAQALGISHVALREGMRSLEALGILEARVGSGWYVKDFSFEPIAKGLALTLHISDKTFADLTDIRLCLECGFLPDAMRALTTEDLGVLERDVADMEKLAQQGETYYEQDRHFHLTIFSRLPNALLGSVMEAFWMLYGYIPRAGGSLPDAELIEIAQEHRRILDAIVAGDVEAARQRLYTNIERAARFSHNVVT